MKTILITLTFKTTTYNIEPVNGGVLLYMKDEIIYKLRKDLKTFKSKYLT